MKILFDTQIFDWQINGGISRYFIELINRLDTDPDNELIFSCIHSYNTYIQNTKWLKINPYFTAGEFKGKLRIAKYANQIVNRRFSNNCLKRGQTDLFHPTYYDPYFLQYIGNKPFVLTVHDLTNEKLPDGSALTKKVLKWRKQLINKASHIISVSENTKNDIVSFYKTDPGKITTIHLASGFDIVSGESSFEEININRGRAYLLFVGSRNGYKNFRHFLNEISGILHKYDIDLLVAGGGVFNSSEIALLKELNINNRIIALPQVSDHYLSLLYKNAMIFIFPSLYEGFGIPALEAMQCECPALLSNNSSLPEVGGTAAAYFDPFNKGDLKNILEKLILNNDARTQMKIRGLQQALKFNWDITAVKHAEVYKLHN